MYGVDADTDTDTDTDTNTVTQIEQTQSHDSHGPTYECKLYCGTRLQVYNTDHDVMYLVTESASDTASLVILPVTTEY